MALAALGIALAAAVVAGMSLRADRQLRTELVTSARELGVHTPELERELRWAVDGDRARIVLGRALVIAGLGEASGSASPKTLSRVAPEVDSETAVARFERAAGLGETVLRERPTSREAATLAGAARYLAWSTARDPRLVAEHERWEEPLRLARRLGPGDREAARFLAMAYLELWASLAESKRTEAREIVAAAFTDLPTYYRLIDAWIAVAGTGARGLEPVPPLPEAWSHLAEQVAARGEASAFCRVHEKLAEAHGARFDERVADARRRLAGGEEADARSRFLQAIAEVPPDGRFAERVAVVLGETPAGPPEPLREVGLRAWLRFALDQDGLGQPVFDIRKLETLIRAAGLVLLGPTTTDATLALAAEGALAANDLVAAERFERQGASISGSPWASYWLTKARVMTERGDGDGLRRALAALAVAAPGEFGVEIAHLRSVVTPSTRAELARFDLRRYGVEAFTVVPEGSRLVFYTARPVRELRLALQPEGSRPSAVAAIRIDGREVACRALQGPSSISVTTALAPGLHRLDVVAPKPLAAYPVELILEP